MKSTYPEFSIPQGFIVPEGVKEGETFEALGTFKLKAKGQMCLIKVDQSSVLDEGAETKDDVPTDIGTSSGMESRLTEAYRQR